MNEMNDMVKTTESANRNYQDTVFRKLFSEKEKIIELYNALEGTDYGPDTEVEVTTLEDVMYVDRKNDLGFTIADRYVVMAEHQSTINPNLPLRDLLYIGRTFEHLIQELKIFSSTMQKIPAPEFFVLYTGGEVWDVEQLRLSDAYKALPPENSLELVVKVVNVEYNKDNEILKRSETLEGYSRLMFYIKENLKKELSLKESIDSAMKRCIEEGWLVDFLKKYSLEVGNMLFQEITREEFTELRAQEAAEVAYEKGHTEGHAKGRTEGLEEGQVRGRTEGLAEGISAFILDNLEEGVSAERIVEKLIKRFHLSKEEAETYLEKEMNIADEAASR